MSRYFHNVPENIRGQVPCNFTEGCNNAARWVDGWTDKTICEPCYDHNFGQRGGLAVAERIAKACKVAVNDRQNTLDAREAARKEKEAVPVGATPISADLEKLFKLPVPHAPTPQEKRKTAKKQAGGAAK